MSLFSAAAAAACRLALKFQQREAGRDERRRKSGMGTKESKSQAPGQKTSLSACRFSI